MSFSVVLIGQNPQQISLKLDSADQKCFNKRKFKFSFSNLESLERFRKDRWDEGYLEASIDTVLSLEGSRIAVFHLGSRYVWSDIELVGDSSYCFQVMEEALNKKKGAYVNVGYLEVVKQNALDCYANSGYPLAQIKQKAKLSDNNVALMLDFDRGQLVTVDSVKIIGGLSFRKKLLPFVTGIKLNEPYSEKAFSEISSKLKALSYVKIDSQPQLRIRRNKASILLYLDQKKTSYLNGIMGFSTDPNNASRLRVNGDFNMHFQNALSYGELFRAEWKSQVDGGQNLEIETSFPSLNKNGTGVKGQIEMFKQDSSFLNFNAGFSLLINDLHANYSLGLVTGFSNVLSIDTVSIIQAQKLPAQLDFIKRSLSIGYGFKKIKEAAYFDRIWSFVLEGGIVFKELLKPQSIATIQTDDLGSRLSSQLDSINQNRWNFEGLLVLESRFVLLRRLALFSKLEAGGYLSNIYLDNEVFVRGGIHSVRGFNDGSLRAHQYVYQNLELHFALDLNSSVYLFSDNAWLEHFLNDLNPWHLGFGMGLKFDMPQGVFSFAYAYGLHESQNFNWTQAKVHFGYINYF